MTFGDEYIKHLTVLQNVGMTGIEPIKYQGREIVPLQFLAAVLPKPETLGETTKGNTNIGVIATGEALDGSGEKTFYINNICSHEAAYEETGNQAVSYTTGVPAMIGSAMMVTGQMGRGGRVQHGRIRSRSLHGHAERARPAVEGRRSWTGRSILLMETKAGDPGAFAQFDLSRVDSPAFVVDAAKLRSNLQVLAEVRDEADIKMLCRAEGVFHVVGRADDRRISRRGLHVRPVGSAAGIGILRRRNQHLLRRLQAGGSGRGLPPVGSCDLQFARPDGTRSAHPRAGAS